MMITVEELLRFMCIESLWTSIAICASNAKTFFKTVAVKLVGFVFVLCMVLGDKWAKLTHNTVYKDIPRDVEEDPSSVGSKRRSELYNLLRKRPKE